MRYIRTLLTVILFSVLNVNAHTEPQDISNTLTSRPEIKEFAISIHAQARSTERLEDRICSLRSLVQNLYTYRTKQKNLPPVLDRYLLLLEDLAWTFHKELATAHEQSSMFALELEPLESRRIKRPVAVKVIEIALKVINEDIRNKPLQEILTAMVKAQQLNNMERYLGLVSALGKIQATLSDPDRDEFDMYRMVLGPQRIVLPE